MLQDALYFGALLIAIPVAVIVAGALLAFDITSKGRAVGLMLALIPLSIAVSTALGNRDISSSLTSLSQSDVQDAGGALLRRLSTMLIFLIPIVRVAQKAWKRDPFDVTGWRYILAFLTYWICSVLLSSILGRQPHLEAYYFYPPLFALGVFMTADKTEKMILFVKYALLFAVFLSLATYLFKPNVVMQIDFKDRILAAFPIRWWGLFPGPNAFAPAIILGLLCTLSAPFRTISFQVLAITLLIAALFLAQSKTNIALLLPLLLILLWYRRGYGDILKNPLARAALFFATAGAALIGVYFISLESQSLNSDTAFQLSTMSGRTQLWQTALNLWARDFWFGYGPLAWSAARRIALGMPYAYHAHNQVMQAVSTAGFLGLIGLLIYVIVLAVGAWKVRLQTRGLSLAVLVLIFGRSVSEIPLQAEVIMSIDFTINLFLLGLILSTLRSQRVAFEVTR